MRTLTSLAVAASLVLVTGTARAAQKIEAQPVSLADLSRTIKDLRGKVVVVDFWADF